MKEYDSRDLKKWQAVLYMIIAFIIASIPFVLFGYWFSNSSEFQ